MVLTMRIGEKLRDAREQRGLSLDDIQEKTKIQKRYLAAIEDENFHILPGSFYARAFIKEYAQALNMDYKALIEEHEDELPSLGERRSEAQYTQIQRTRKSSGPSKATAVFSFLPTVILLLLVMIIIALAIYFIQQRSFNPTNTNNEPNNEANEFYRSENNRENENQTNNNNANNNNENNAEENDEANNEEIIELEFKVAETREDVTPPVTIYNLIHSDQVLNLRIESSNKSWLDLDHDEDRLFSGFIEPSNSPLEYEIESGEELIFNIGDASYVDIYINDLKLDYEIDEVEKVYQRITVKMNEED